MTRLVEQAQEGKAAVQRLADRVAALGIFIKGGGNQQRTGQPLQQMRALLAMIIVVVDDGHDRSGVDHGHAAVPGGSVRRISSLRSARSGSACW